MSSPTPQDSPSNRTNLTGRWIGCYYQHSRPHPIEADLIHDGEQITGVMRDGETDRNSTVFEVAADAGLPPGADEQIEASLRAMFPEERATPIRYIAHLPTDSVVEGWARGFQVGFLKSYQGEHYGGYTVGDRFVGHRIEGHAVHYRGDVSLDGREINGKWSIDPDPEIGTPGTDGSFSLRRQTEG